MGFNPFKAIKHAAEKAADTVKDAANTTVDTAKDAANATVDVAKDAANSTVDVVSDATKLTVGAAKIGIKSAANLSESTVLSAANVAGDLTRGDFDAIAKEGEKLAESAIKNGIPVIQEVAKLGDGVSAELESQINSALAPVNLTLSDFTGPINKVTDELKGVANYLVTTVLNEVLKALLLKKAKDAIQDKLSLITDVVTFFNGANKIPQEYYDYLKQSGLADLTGVERGGKLSEFPFFKHLGSSYSIGYALDVSPNGVNVGTSPALAIDKHGKAKGIFSYGVGFSSPGASNGIEFGYWVADTQDLEGNYWSVTLSGAGAGINNFGGSITVAFGLLNLDFQGVTFEVNAGTGPTESIKDIFSISVGRTSFIH